jgi:hypothetical protein
MTNDDMIILGFFGTIALLILLWGLWTFYIEPKLCEKAINKYFPDFYQCLETYKILYDTREKIADEKKKTQSAIDRLTKELQYFEVGSKDYAILCSSICKLKKQYNALYNEYHFKDYVFKGYKEEFKNYYSFVTFNWINDDKIKEDEWTLWDILRHYRELKRK